jgi:hypothetical protein
MKITKILIPISLTAILALTSCIKEISSKTYTGEVTSKEYHVWKTMGGYYPSFKFTLNTEEGIKEIDMTCPQTRDIYEEDIQNEVKPYGSQEFKANNNIKIGDTLEVTITDLKVPIFYSCPKIEYKKK